MRQGDYLDTESLKRAFKGIEIRKPNSTYVLQEVTKEDIFTEKLLKSSGLIGALVNHPPFFNSINLYIGLNAPGAGVRFRKATEDSPPPPVMTWRKLMPSS